MVHIHVCDQKNRTQVANIELGCEHDMLLKYYNTCDKKIGSLPGFTMDYTKKGFKQKLFRIKFPTKVFVDAYVNLSQKWS